MEEERLWRVHGGEDGFRERQGFCRSQGGMECICLCYVEFILFLDQDAEREGDVLENWGRTRSGMPDDIAHRDTTQVFYI